MSQASTTSVLSITMDHASDDLLNQHQHHNDDAIRNIAQMSKKQLIMRQEQLVQEDLSFNSSIRREKYIELGLILIKLKSYAS